LRLRIAAVNSAIDIGRWDVALRHVGTAEALRPDLPPDLIAVVRRAMRKEPGDRYPDMASMVEALRQFRRHSDTQFLPAARRRSTDGGGSWPWIALLAVAALIDREDVEADGLNTTATNWRISTSIYGPWSRLAA